MICRNLSRAGLVFARAFADNRFDEPEEIFEAEWWDLMAELLEVAKQEREKRMNYWLRSEKKMIASEEEK